MSKRKNKSHKKNGNKKQNTIQKRDSTVSKQKKNNTAQYKLGWYFTFVKVALVLIAAINLFRAYNVFCGQEYEESRFLYDEYSGLESVDTFYSVSMFFMAIYAVIVLVRLGMKKKNALKLLYILSVAEVMVSVIYAIGVMFTTGLLIFGDVFILMIVPVAFLLANGLYFEKRKGLFTK